MWIRGIVLGVVLLVAGPFMLTAAGQVAGWKPEELQLLKGLWLGSLMPLPPDPSNRVADDERAVALGHKLFFDTRFSANGAVSCATCHRPELDFQDGTPLAHGIGTTTRRTNPLAGVAYSSWFFWDGRKDSLWAQVTAPMESAVEHGGNRTMYAHLIARHYRFEYEALFGLLPDLADSRRFPASAGPVDDPAARAAWDAMAPDDKRAVSQIYANMGKAMAAYERKLMPGPARFDDYVAALLQGDSTRAAEILTPDEVAGLRLFISKGECTRCHFGPLFTDNQFHNTGVPAAPDLPADTGRMSGVEQVLADEFNCLGVFSDAGPDGCAELKLLQSIGGGREGAFKPPSLRNVAERAPYMHAGQFATLQRVLEHYNQAPASPLGFTVLDPLNLTAEEVEQLDAFLRTLSAPLAVPPELLKPPTSPLSVRTYLPYLSVFATGTPE